MQIGMKMNWNKIFNPSIFDALAIIMSNFLWKKVIEKQWTGTGAIKRQIPLLKPKREINKYYKLTKYKENKLLIERAAISQKVATQQPKLN